MPPRSVDHAGRRSAPDRFDAEYYRRFYGNSRSRVSDLEAVKKLASFVAGYLRYLEVPVRSILDVGCGLGHWQRAAAELWPRARYHGVEHSEHLCARFGWTQASIVDFDAHAAIGVEQFDFVICQGVLQYLDDRQAARAIGNLAKWCGGALYLEALTALDWRRNCDQSRTDGDVHLRSGAWYRRRLARRFVSCGGGVFCSKDAGATLFELEGT